MKTIINRITGQELYATVLDFEDTETQIAIDELRTEAFENPYFNFETREFYNYETN
jgi:hypothetical protein